MTGLGSSCGACRFLRRRCTNECVFAPYFCYDEATSHFAAVHKVFGASNVSKLLLQLPVHTRSEAAVTISYEALARMQDPIYGCVAHIFALQQQVDILKEEIELIGNQMANTTLAFDAPSCTSSQLTQNSINGMQFYSERSKMNKDNFVDQQSSLPYTGNTIPENEEVDDQVNEHLPPLNIWEDEVAGYNYDLNISDIILFESDIYQLHPWEANGSNFN